jgi:hypothetical protein
VYQVSTVFNVYNEPFEVIRNEAFWLSFQDIKLYANEDMRRIKKVCPSGTRIRTEMEKKNWTFGKKISKYGILGICALKSGIYVKNLSHHLFLKSGKRRKHYNTHSKSVRLICHYEDSLLEYQELDNIEFQHCFNIKIKYFLF